MRTNLLLFVVLFSTLFSTAQSPQFIADIDGNQYTLVRLGTQTWMGQNLNVTRFRNGDVIQEANSRELWLKADLEGIPAWCYYNNDPSYAAVYGKLYNWYAVTDPRGLAPAKWHIPNREEWNRMINFLGGNKQAGIRLKDTSFWHNNGNGTNKSLFAARPGGSRTDEGRFLGQGKFGYWWSRQENAGATAWGTDMGFSYPQINMFGFRKGNGFSVRCVRD